MAPTVQAIRTWDDAIVLQCSETTRYEFLIRKTGEAWQPGSITRALSFNIASRAADCLNDPKALYRADGLDTDVTSWVELTKGILSRQTISLDVEEPLLHALLAMQQWQSIHEKLSSLFRFVPTNQRGVKNLRFNSMFWCFEQIHDVLSGVSDEWWSMDAGIRLLLDELPTAMGFAPDAIPHWEPEAIEQRIRRFADNIVPGREDAVFADIMGFVTERSPVRPDGSVNTERLLEFGQRVKRLDDLKQKVGLSPSPTPPY